MLPQASPFAPRYAGAAPRAQLPIEQPGKAELNLKTAKALGRRARGLNEIAPNTRRDVKVGRANST